MLILKGTYKEWLKSVVEKNIKIKLIRVLGAMNFESYNLNDNQCLVIFFKGHVLFLEDESSGTSMENGLKSGQLGTRYLTQENAVLSLIQ